MASWTRRTRLSRLTKRRRQRLHRRALGARPAAAESHAAILAAYDSLPHPLTLFRTDGVLVAINRANEAIIGASREDLIGKYNTFLDPESERHGYNDHIRRAARGEVAVMPPTPYNPAKAGTGSRETDLWAETTYFPILTSDGRLSFVGELYLDVTELKSAQEALKRAHEDLKKVNEELERRIEERTADLLRINHSLELEIAERARMENERSELLERERRAREEAEVANRAKDQFLAILSHELRTPLTTIVTWAQLLKAKKLDEAKTRKAIDMIERSSLVQAQVVDDLLDISRIIAGKLSLEVAEVDPLAVIHDSVESIRGMAEAKSLRLETDLDSSVRRVLADPIRLQQVLWNLLTNALKFTDPGGVLRIRLDSVEGQVRFQVSDSGRGIPPEYLSRIFERFTQVDSSTTRAHGGLGLGLAISRSLVVMMGGRIEAESPGPEGGAMFTVLLPQGPSRAA